MSFQIESADKTPYGLIINRKGQALTNSIIIPELTEAAEIGEAYYLATGFVAVTAAQSDSAIMHIKNTFNKTIKIDKLRTCGTQVQKWILLKGPTLGTIIDDDVTCYENNLNLGSGNLWPAKCVRATVGGKTFTDGGIMSQWINNVGESMQEFSGSIVISPGKTLGLKVDVLADADVCVTILIYLCD